MQRTHHDISIWVFIGIFLLLLIGFGGTYLYSEEASEEEHTYYFSGDTLSTVQGNLSISIMHSKNWQDEALHPNIPTGAQYDAVLTNSSGLLFKDWSAEVVFSEDVVIDSYWNGLFSSNGNTLLFRATGVPANVEPYDHSSFGAVMYSKSIMQIESCKISGYWNINMYDLPMFWVLTAATLIWLVTLIIHIVIRIRTAQYLKRQELDSAIIRQSMNTFISFIDAKDSYTKGHSARVAAFSAEIGRRLKMDKEEAERLFFITLMHDCGKIGIPDSVLKKPGKLDSEEYELIKSHTTLGDSVLVNFTAIPGIRDGAHYHHERYDGKGYPDGLSGNDIPLYARIICVADSYDAMSSNRCYRPRLENKEILRELIENAGKQFDPEIVTIMIQMIGDGFTREIQAEYPNYEDEDLPNA